jgi:hypothetical protein
VTTAFQADAFQNDAFQVDAAVIPGIGPAGAATFVLDLEAATVTYDFATEINKMWDGSEQRIAPLSSPKRSYQATAFLAGRDDRNVRSKLVQAAATGQPFLVGLAYEELTIAADASGTTVNVSAAALALTDWARTGQRVVCVGPDDTTKNAVIQSAPGGGSTIVLDVAPGTAGARGGRIMPAMAVYLDAEQGFARELVNASYWNLRAVAALFGFAGVDTMGLGATLTTFDGLYVFDKGLAQDGQAADQIHSLAEVIDFGGVPTAAGGAAVSDWGREVKLVSDLQATWQWFKAFIYAVRGAQVAWLLPTERPDFVFVSKTSSSVIKIQSGSVDGAGDITKWFGVSQAHKYLQIIQTNGTRVYGKISTVVDNGDGTVTVTLTSGVVTGTPAVISWLELVRFENGAFPVSWAAGYEFSYAGAAHVIQG